MKHPYKQKRERWLHSHIRVVLTEYSSPSVPKALDLEVPSKWHVHTPGTLQDLFQTPRKCWNPSCPSEVEGGSAGNLQILVQTLIVGPRSTVSTEQKLVKLGLQMARALSYYFM